MKSKKPNTKQSKARSTLPIVGYAIIVKGRPLTMKRNRSEDLVTRIKSTHTAVMARQLAARRNIKSFKVVALFRDDHVAAKMDLYIGQVQELIDMAQEASRALVETK